MIAETQQVMAEKIDRPRNPSFFKKLSRKKLDQKEKLDTFKE